MERADRHPGPQKSGTCRKKPFLFKCINSEEEEVEEEEVEEKKKKNPAGAT